MNTLFRRIAVAAVISTTLTLPANAQSYFPTPERAQQHCPNDIVVWLNIPTHIYHMPGTRWYGATKNGMFVCEREADKAGDRQSRNGQ
jgi:hypothetical protein